MVAVAGLEPAHQTFGTRELNPYALRIVASTLPFGHTAISQPCIYIISYSVEFVKRFSTLFKKFFLCGFDFMFLLELSL